MSTNKKAVEGFSSLVSFLTIVIALGIGIAIYKLVLGAEANFADHNPETGHPENLLGTMYKGGVIVPILLATNIIIIIFSIERFVTISKGKGKGKIDSFVLKVKNYLNAKDLSGAIAECDKQKGSIGNVVKAGLEKYQTIQHDTDMNKEQKVESIKKELEEATALELPMLSKNLVVISTCASIATLIGLIGTVLGMIKSFAAMSAGQPDPAALAVGISEALVNTFLGIFGSAVAIIMYNFFSTKIDQMTYSMDEASFTIVQDFSASNK